MTEQMDAKAARAARADFSLDGTRTAAGLIGADRKIFWEEFERVGQLLLPQKWIFAKTMAHNPHWYTLRREWTVDADFQWVVTQLRLRGYRAKFGKTWYTQLNLNDHFYWTMGYAMNWPNGNPLTALINRKPVYGLEGHSPLFDTVDPMDMLPHSALAARVYGRLGDMDGLSVLEIGCGLGQTIPYTHLALHYLGIDPSKRMLDTLHAAYPTVPTMCTRLIDFVPPTYGERYDLVLALFGTGNLLTREELERIPLLLNPGGTAWVMFDTTQPIPDPAGLFHDVHLDTETDGDFVLCRITT